jgi:hypothetical protein
MAKTMIELEMQGNVREGAQALWDIFNESIGQKGIRKLESFATVNAARSLSPFVRAAAPRDQGLLAKSVRGRRSRLNKQGAIVGPVAGKKAAWYAWLVVRGTKAHRMPKLGATRRAAMWFGMQLHSVVMHPGARPNNFVDRAVEANIEKAKDAFGGTIVLMINDAAFRQKVLGFEAAYKNKKAAHWQSQPFGRHWKNADWLEPFHNAIRRPVRNASEIDAAGLLRDRYKARASGIGGVVPRMNRP